LALLLLMAFI